MPVDKIEMKSRY